MTQTILLFSFYCSLSQCFSEPESLFSQNLNCTDLCSSIFSTSSIETPLVSGTKTMTKKIATMATIPNSMNVHAVPIASVRDKKDSATMRLEIQTVVDAIPPHTPLYLKGQISEFTTHGTVPMPGEKNMMYRARPIRAAQPYLLGHPVVYHALWSLPHIFFVSTLAIKHAPGKSCKFN